MSVVIFVCCQVEVPVSGCHSSKGVLVNVVCVTEFDLETLTAWRLRSAGGCWAVREKVICRVSRYFVKSERSCLGRKG